MLLLVFVDGVDNVPELSDEEEDVNVCVTEADEGEEAELDEESEEELVSEDFTGCAQ